MVLCCTGPSSPTGQFTLDTHFMVRVTSPYPPPALLSSWLCGGKHAPGQGGVPEWTPAPCGRGKRQGEERGGLVGWRREKYKEGGQEGGAGVSVQAIHGAVWGDWHNGERGQHCGSGAVTLEVACATAAP